MQFYISEPIRAGVSACNFGAKVRYNHVGWDRVALLEREYDRVLWTPVCPEVMSGLGVPRLPMRLSGGNGFDFWEGKAAIKNREGRNLTETIKEGLTASLELLKRSKVEAFFFMEGSPTCGVYRTTLKDRRLGKPPGAFGALLLKENYFLVPALDLESPVKWWDWKRRLFAFVWLGRQKITDKPTLYEIWHLLKFLCQEVDRNASDLIGRNLAAMPKKIDSVFIESWRKSVLALLRRPSTILRIKSMLQKHYAHYRRALGLKPAELPAPEDVLGKRKLVAELTRMELRSLEAGIDFPSVPVHYKSSR
jgi:uncharacterized protein YbbK (DUF523 family)